MIEAVHRIGQTLARRHVLELDKTIYMIARDTADGLLVMAGYSAYLGHVIGHLSAVAGLTPSTIIQTLALALAAEKAHAN